jgi:hypothetical protein
VFIRRQAHWRRHEEEREYFKEIRGQSQSLIRSVADVLLNVAASFLQQLQSHLWERSFSHGVGFRACWTFVAVNSRPIVAQSLLVLDLLRLRQLRAEGEPMHRAMCRAAQVAAPCAVIRARR